MQCYESYKPTSIEWAPDIPAKWEVQPIRALFNERKERNEGPKTDFILSVMKDIGVIPYDEKGNVGNKKSENIENYKVVYPGDLVVNKMNAIIGSLGISRHHGALSQVYFVLYPKDHSRTNHKYLGYLFRVKPFQQSLIKISKGMMELRESIEFDEFKKLVLPVPPLDEQDRIVAFLDQKTAEIDAAITKKERLIELLEEQKAILINRAVTQGLNPDARKNESGISWINTIPSHWQVKRAKYLFREIDERSVSGEEELLSVSHMTGVTPRSEKTNIYMFMAEDYSGSKLCRPTDLVFNTMWAWMGALGVSDRTGIVSPSYGVYRQLKEGTFNNWYLEHLLRSTPYVAEYNKRSTGLHSSRLRLYSHMFFDMELGFPPREEQDKIEYVTKKQVSQADAVITSVRSEIVKLTELRSSLVASVVTGKMRV